MKIGQLCLAILAVSLAPPGASLAQKSKPAPSCEETAQSQDELTACAMSGAKEADQRLNRAYREVLR